MKKTALACIETLLLRYPVLCPCEKDLYAALETMAASYRDGGRLLVCGNGGSAADSLHIVGELMKGFVLPRKVDAQTQEALRAVSPDTADYLIANLQGALPAVSLVSEVGLSTAYANDQAPDLAFAQQVLGQGREGDVLFAISTSGNSLNVLYAAQVARAKGIRVIGLTGQGGGKLRAWADVLLAAPEKETFKIQELHLPVYHALCLALEQEFFGEDR